MDKQRTSLNAGSLLRKAQENKYRLGAAFVWAITAWFSAGYHHPDEHFQILELAFFKAGQSTDAALAWEYHARIRPGLQPLLAFGAIKCMALSGLTNPFYQVFLLRLLSAGLVLILLRAWVIRIENEEPRLQKGLSAFNLVFFCWFVPYLSVRFSSENWAGLTWMGAMLFLLQSLDNQGLRRHQYLFVAGLLSGLSFFFRFQMAFAIVGAAAWLVFYRKLPVNQWLWLAAGGVISLLIGISADFWLYGAWEPTAFHYFRANILENKAAQWGTEPWWFYLTAFLLTALPPVSILVAGLAFWGGYQHRNHLFVWVLVPFLTAHSAIGHKELRFLFPLVLPFLLLAAMGWNSAKDFLTGNKKIKIALKACLILNMAALLGRSLLPANEAFPTLQYLYRAYREEPFRLFAVGNDPFNQVGLRLHFYAPKGIETTVLPSLAPLDTLLVPANSLLIYPKMRLPDTLKNVRATRMYTYFPGWIAYLNINDWQSRSYIWSVYQISKK